MLFFRINYFLAAQSSLLHADFLLLQEQGLLVLVLRGLLTAAASLCRAGL